MCCLGGNIQILSLVVKFFNKTEYCDKSRKREEITEMSRRLTCREERNEATYWKAITIAQSLNERQLLYIDYSKDKRIGRVL